MQVQKARDKYVFTIKLFVNVHFGKCLNYFLCTCDNNIKA